MRKGARVIALVLAVGALAPSGALGQTGAPVVDQSWITPGDPSGTSGLLPASGSFGDSFGRILIGAQTFTAGRDGVLTGMNVDLYEANDPVVPVSPVRVSIRNTEVADFGNTVPGPTVFTTTVLNSQVVPLSQLIVFPQLLQVQAGAKYAIVFSIDNPAPNDSGGLVGTAGLDGYPGGEACFSEDGGAHWFCDVPSQHVDWHFQTCVSPSPASNDVSPSAIDDSATVQRGSSATTINVLGNDGNADGGPMALVGNSDAAHGTVALADCGADLTYTPDANYSGPGSFTYTLNGGSTATVSVRVTDPTDTKLAGRARAARTQRQSGKRIVVRVKVRAEERLTARATGKIKVNPTYKLKPQKVKLATGETKKLKLKPKKAKAQRISRALKRGEKAKAKVTVKLTDLAGNRETEKLRVRLKR